MATLLSYVQRVKKYPLSKRATASLVISLGNKSQEEVYIIKTDMSNKIEKYKKTGVLDDLLSKEIFVYMRN